MGTISVTDLVRIGVKLYAEDPDAVDPRRFIGIFHGWIQRGAVSGLPIDVADYSHVHEGPGVMLIGHEADRAIDLGEGRPGVLYQRKRDAEGTLEDRFRQALEEAWAAARLIEADPDAGGVRVRDDELLVRVMERLATSDDEATWDAVRPALEAALGQVYPGRTATIERIEERGGPLAVRVRLS